MALVKLRFPILRKAVVDRWALEIFLPMEVRTSQGTWRPLPFCFDTGTQLTTIPVVLARQLSIPFTTARPVTIQGTTGQGRGYLSPISFAVDGLPRLQFPALCCFSQYDLKQPLFSLTDLMAQFTFASAVPSTRHPLGSFVIRLRSDHQGQPRE